MSHCSDSSLDHVPTETPKQLTRHTNAKLLLPSTGSHGLF